MKFEIAVKKYLTTKAAICKEKTIRDYKIWFDALGRLEFNGKDINEINMVNVDRFVDLRIKEAGPSSVNRELASLKRLMLFCHERDFLLKFPKLKLDFLQENPRERSFTDGEIKKLFKACQQSSRPLYLFPIAMVAYRTGLRKIDILTLKRSEVDLENRFIHKEHIAKKRQIRPSSKPITDDLLAVLTDWLATDTDSEWVFPSPKDKNKPLASTVKMGFTAALKEAGIKGGQFRDLRRTFATKCAASGMAIEVVQELLDHEDINTTRKIYLQVNQERLQKEMEKLK
jgi:integrase